MRANLELTHGALFSQRALTALVESGMARDDAYRLVQEPAQRAWDDGHAVPRPARRAPAARTRGSAVDWDAVFDASAYLAHVPELIDRLESLRGSDS